MTISGTSPQLAGIRDRLESARAQTDALFDIIRPDAMYDRPVPERHRLIFYLGHLEAFDWNQICRGALDLPSFHATFDKLFEFGIDPEPGTAASDTPGDWPSIDQVRAYNREVRARLDAVLEQAPAQIVNVALEHRQMHAETLAYLMHEMPHGKKRSVPQEALAATGAPNRIIEIPGGTVTLGQRAGDFGWDNEFSEHRLRVEPFQISKYKITNGEYLSFIKAGAPLPHFWAEEDGRLLYRGMFDFVPLPLDWPVYVTYDQARAYAAWAGKRLPTEAAFHRAAYGERAGGERAYPWGDDLPDHSRGNFDFARWDPAPVSAYPDGDSAFGVSQMVGNGWEWTSTPFGPFAGFQPFPFYPGYSQNFFDGRHFVLKGGSPRTAADLLRRSFRNWFRPNYPYVYATFRVVENG